MFFKFFYFFLCIFLVPIFFSSRNMFSNDENIRLFKADIKVNRDGSYDITEEITFNKVLEENFVRKITTFYNYEDVHNSFICEIDVKKLLKNGKEINYIKEHQMRLNEDRFFAK